MDIVSCNWCGVVLDAHKLAFPDPDGNMDGDSLYATDQYEWVSDKFVPIVKCPVCQSSIRKGDE